jgi:hypothetical protein
MRVGEQRALSRARSLPDQHQPGDAQALAVFDGWDVSRRHHAAAREILTQKRQRMLS